MPIEKGIITSSFGNRKSPISKKDEFHNGIDIGAEMGTDIMAIDSGKVTEAYTSPTFGNVLVYETVDGYKIMIAHLKGYYKKIGDEIKIGEKIAGVGSTGMSTGPHLHLSIWKDDALIDPISFFEYDVIPDVLKEYEDRGEIFIR